MSLALLQFFFSAAIIVVSGIGMAHTARHDLAVTGIGQLLGGALLIAIAISLPDLLFGTERTPPREAIPVMKGSVIK